MPVRFECRAEPAVSRCVRHRPVTVQRVNGRFERGDRDVGADRAAQGFVTHWWWRVPAGEFGLSPDLFDAALVPTERARTFRRVRGEGTLVSWDAGLPSCAVRPGTATSDTSPPR